MHWQDPENIRQWMHSPHCIYCGEPIFDDPIIEVGNLFHDDCWEDFKQDYEAAHYTLEDFTTDYIAHEKAFHLGRLATHMDHEQRKN